MRIKHNILGKNAYRNLSASSKKRDRNMERLSSGLAINRAADDAAGLAISEKMKLQTTGMNRATENVKEGIGLVKVMDGALQEYQDILQRMNALAYQSSNGTLDNEVDRPALQKEFDALREELDSIAQSTQYNGIPCFTPDVPVVESVPPEIMPPVVTKPTLDVVFVLDRTGSMGNPIKNVKDNLNQFVSHMEDVDLRIGIAHYTNDQQPLPGQDPGDPQDPIRIHRFTNGTQFTSDTAEIAQVLEQLAASTPGSKEDGLDAISEALNMDFRPDAAKHLILLGDEVITSRVMDDQAKYQEVTNALKDSDTTLTVIGNAVLKEQLCGSDKMTGENNFMSISSNFAQGLEKLGNDIVVSLPEEAPPVEEPEPEDEWLKLDHIPLQIGSDGGETLEIERRHIIPKYYELDEVAIDPMEKAQEALEKLYAAINGVSEYRGTLGADMNRLEHALNVLGVSTENLTDALSVIRDADMATEYSAYVANNIINQSAQAMLAQANQLPQGVLQLMQ